MASFSLCQMVSSVFEYTCSAGERGWIDGRALTQGDMGTGREKAGKQEGARDAWEAPDSFSHIVPGQEWPTICPSKLQTPFIQPCLHMLGEEVRSVMDMSWIPQ
jgi:hypothetical protein